MRLRERGFVLLSAAAALAAIAGLSISSDAAMHRVTATIGYASSGVVTKTSDISFPPSPDVTNTATAITMDSYGLIWIQQGDVLRAQQGRTGVITVNDTGNQLINFVTGNMRFDQGLEPLKVICSMHATSDYSCQHLLAPALGKEKTLYIALNLLVNNSGKAKKTAYGPFTEADASSSIDISVVYQ